MNDEIKWSDIDYPPAQYKPRISFNNEYGCWQCTDGGVTFYGERPVDAFNELMSIR
jgi:hypothetical protein